MVWGNFIYSLMGLPVPRFLALVRKREIARADRLDHKVRAVLARVGVGAQHAFQIRGRLGDSASICIVFRADKSGFDWPGWSSEFMRRVG